MNISAPFIDLPVATTLLTIGITLAGAVAFLLLPVSPLPRVDLPTITVSASLPGASPETMAATVAMPLERSLGRIAGITEMTSASRLGSTEITLQFDLGRNIDAAGRDVQLGLDQVDALDVGERHVDRLREVGDVRRAARHQGHAQGRDDHDAEEHADDQQERVEGG